PDLVQLTSSNWSSSISQGSWLIEFYSPYCTPCKAFLPLWAELVKNKATLASDDPAAPFRLAQVNCHAQGDLCVQEGVPHFPRLSLYKDGKMAQSEYQGNREYTELAAWIDEEVKDYRQSKGSTGAA
ncbi:thioredoxin domain-containing protein, partial [Microstroma glucosiphilum]